ncbi:MAG: Holliday junction branch migration protein RuvA [Clostridia bacterium]|nr:Holliday junction branch migration protein RuvA [Clostridia bacterium]
MLAYIKGTLEMKMTGYIVIDVGGLGYKIFMSEVGIEKIGNIGESVKVHTYYKVREDDISIYGFNTLEELKMFELLIGVSGVGAKTALTMLAVCEPSEFALAVIAEDIKTLTGIPGIGAKSAQRIILELKDKITKEQQIEKINEQLNSQSKATDQEETQDKLQIAIENNNKIAEAIAALQVLGYNKKEIEKVFAKLDKNELSTEELIKKGLNLLGV